MKILGEFETIEYLLTTNSSIARYGDGELKLCLGKAAISQPFSSELQKRLKEVLKAKQEKFIVGIPRIYDEMPIQKRVFWNKYEQEKFRELYNESNLYGSAFITRPDSTPHIDNAEYYDLVKQLWKGRKVFLFQGFGRRFLKAKPSLFETAESYSVTYGPCYNAFAEYKDILNLILKNTDLDTLVVLSLGATATVLSYDLSKTGRTSLDLGHLGMFYAHIHPKSVGYSGEGYPKDGK